MNRGGLSQSVLRVLVGNMMENNVSEWNEVLKMKYAGIYFSNLFKLSVVKYQISKLKAIH